MLLIDYQFNLQTIIQKYVAEGFILSFTFSIDTRTIYLGFIQGRLDFIDASVLFFKEYVDVQLSIDKLAYSFHYQDSGNNLIFRYDNAKHKPDLGFSDHKHIQDKIISSSVPDLENIILEVTTEYL